MTVDPRLMIWPKGADVAEVKAVVESLDLGYVVRPFWYTEHSEGVERVLVLAEGFQHGTIVDYIRPLKKEQMPEAVRWALGLQAESRGARLAQATWDRIFGAPVKIGVWDDVHQPNPLAWRD